MINMQYMSSRELSQLSSKILKEYINAYNLPNKLALEKDDLVKIIFNTRPISNESECYYRCHRTRKVSNPASAASTGGNSNSNDNNDNEHSTGGLDPASLASSFSNRVQDLFTTTFSNPYYSQQQQQQEQQQQYPPPPSQYSHQRPPQPQQHHQPANHQHSYRPPPPPQNHYYRPNRPNQEPSRPSTMPSSSSSNNIPSTSTTSNDNLITIHDMIKSRIDPASLSVRTLKSILKANFVEQSHVLEKSELVKLVQRLMDQYKPTTTTSSRHGPNSNHPENDDNVYKDENDLCKICFDAQQNCVFLDCGHMCTCMDCAKKLIETKNECPICRESIIKLVHVFRT